MPQLKINHIVSFSSEDPQHPSSNLIASQISKKKWLSAKGECSLSVVLQLEKCSQITSVHIGSYHSALVEVLVARSETPGVPFKVLVPSSIFMTPSEARKNEAVSAVRTFSGDQLQGDTKNEKWDRIRIVCSQPYNKHCQFGLTFVHVFGTESSLSSDKPEAENSSLSLGRFKLRPHSSDEEDLSGPTHFRPGELFAKLKEQNKLSTDAQIRQSSSPTTLKNLSKTDSPSFLVKANLPSKGTSHSCKDSKVKTPDSKCKTRNDVMYDDEDGEPNEKIDRLVEKDRREKAKIKHEDNKRVKKDEGKHRNDSAPDKHNEERKKDISSIFSKNKNNDSHRSKESSFKGKDNAAHEPKHNTSIPEEPSKQDRKRHADENEYISPASKKPRPSTSSTIEASSSSPSFVPYHSIMKDVVFVFSGYVNPQRSNLRDKALAMGARYKQDWTHDSTHLICAFPNTPKLQQVRKSSNPNAVVVTANWIDECHLKKKLLPWEWFATEPKRQKRREKSPSPALTMGDNRKADISISDADTDDEIEKVLKEQMLKYNENQKHKQDNLNNSRDKDNKSPKAQKNPAKFPKDDSSDVTDIDEDELNALAKTDKVSISDEEMCNLPEEEKPSTATPKAQSLPDIEMQNSGETVLNYESQNSNPNSGFDLPDFFSDINFYIDPEIENDGFDVEKLTRYIVAYNGNIIKALTQNSDVNFILSFRKKNGFDSLQDSVRIVKPNWVWECNDSKKKVSFSKHIVS